MGSLFYLIFTSAMVLLADVYKGSCFRLRALDINISGLIPHFAYAHSITFSSPHFGRAFDREHVARTPPQSYLLRELNITRPLLI